MEKVGFEGIIETGDHTVVAALIEKWLGPPEVKTRIFGEELVYQDDTIYVYAHNPVVGGAEADEFLIEGYYMGDLDSARALLERLGALCASRQIALEVEYVQLDADDNPIGDTYEL